MTTFSGEAANLGKAFDEAWKAISEEYAGALIDLVAAREALARSVLAAATSQPGDLTGLADKALADFKANYLVLKIAKRA